MSVLHGNIWSFVQMVYERQQAHQRRKQLTTQVRKGDTSV